MKKTTFDRIKMISALLMIFILIMTAISAYAAEGAPAGRLSASTVDASGTCGDKLTWTLTSNGKLTVSGSGKMSDYFYDEAPWYEKGRRSRPSRSVPV